MMQTKGPKGKKREPLLFEPRLVGGLKTTVIKKVACGDMFTACLTGKQTSLTSCSINSGPLQCEMCTFICLNTIYTYM